MPTPGPITSPARRVPSFASIRYGGSIGGPVDIPKVYHGKDRTFFFFSYSVFQRHFQNTDARTVLTAPARNWTFTYQGADGATHTVNLLTASSRESADQLRSPNR